MIEPLAGNGTKDDPWVLRTPSDAPLAEFEADAPHHPVFRLTDTSDTPSNLSNDPSMRPAR
jgi:hypothetical protein